MKILNFSAVEVLPALLSKAKIQTIRPAWHEDKQLKPFADAFTKEFIKPLTSKAKLVYNKEKPARFKVGEQVQLMWYQRSKENHFCCFCGKKSHIGDRTSYLNCITAGSFYKLLGTATITEVF